MTSAHVLQRGISFSSVGKPVNCFPVFGQQMSKRITFRQADADTIVFSIAIRCSGEIMWIADHKAGIVIRVDVDFQRLLRPNSG